MSKLMKESISNIYRGEKGENPKERVTEGNFEYSLGSKLTKSNRTTSESSLNVCEPSIFYEGINKTNSRTEEEYQKPVNIRNNETSSDIVSSVDEMRNYFNFFSLPKFGLCEMATQTMLSGRDLDNLDYMQTELKSCREDLIAYVFSSKSNETLRRLFPSTEEERKVNKDNPLMSRDNNFINIKRANDGDLQATRRSRTAVISPDSHIHYKAKQTSKGGRRRKNKEDEQKIREDSIGRSESSETKVKEFTPNVTSKGKESSLQSKDQSREQSYQQSHGRKNFNEEFDITNIINDIKNSSSRKEQIKKQDNNSNLKEDFTNIHNGTSTGVTSTSYKDEASSTSQKKIHQPRKWDAFQYFKSEFASAHKDLTEEELDKISRKEWNSLDKDTKKIYNMNAERERKNHKLKKKKQMQEQMQKHSQSQDDEESNK